MIVAGRSSRIARDVASHLNGVLERTPVAGTPFSHIYVEDVFPPDIYAEMLDRMPPLDAFSPDNPRKYGRAAEERRPSGRAARLIEGLLHVSSSRYTLPLNGTGLSRLEDGPRAIWSGVAEALASRTLQHRIFALFADDLCRRFRTDRRGLDRLTLYPRATLVRDLSGYWIAPHPDTRAKVVTMQFYLARDLSQRDLGTAFYVRHLFNPRNLLSLRNMFEKVKQMEFAPNTAYAFPVSRRSWHGRESVRDDAGERNSILLFYYLDPAGEW